MSLRGLIRRRIDQVKADEYKRQFSRFSLNYPLRKRWRRLNLTASKPSKNPLSIHGCFLNYLKITIKVKINYDNIYNVDLVIMPFDTSAVLASSGKHTLKVSDFYIQLRNLTLNTLSNILEIDNSIKLVHYYFSEEHNISGSEVVINMPLLKNVILDYSRRIQIAPSRIT